MSKYPMFPRKNLTSPPKEPLSENSGLLVTLSDLTLLLLCGVVIWHVIDKQAALRQYMLGSSGATAPALAPPPPPLDAVMEFSPIVPTFKQEDMTLTASTVPVEEHPNRWELLKKEIEASVAGSGLDDRVLITTTHNDLSIALKETVLFARGKADLSHRIFPVLEKVAALAHNHSDLALEVLGHTDDTPIATAEFPSNWELSTTRATRVARHLVKIGISPIRISAQGYASFRPLVANTSDESRAINRRVEIRLYRKGKARNDANL